jgi:hypothetical protein
MQKTNQLSSLELPEPALLAIPVMAECRADLKLLSSATVSLPEPPSSVIAFPHPLGRRLQVPLQSISNPPYMEGL